VFPLQSDYASVQPVSSIEVVLKAVNQLHEQIVHVPIRPQQTPDAFLLIYFIIICIRRLLHCYNYNVTKHKSLTSASPKPGLPIKSYIKYWFITRPLDWSTALMDGITDGFLSEWLESGRVHRESFQIGGVGDKSGSGSSQWVGFWGHIRGGHWLFTQKGNRVGFEQEWKRNHYRAGHEGCESKDSHYTWFRWDSNSSTTKGNNSSTLHIKSLLHAFDSNLCPGPVCLLILAINVTWDI